MLVKLLQVANDLLGQIHIELEILLYHAVVLHRSTKSLSGDPALQKLLYLQ